MDLSMLVVVIVVALGVLALLSTLGRRRPAPEAATFPYERRPLFTAAERSFLGVLDGAIAGQYRIFGKVRLIDVVNVKSGTPPAEARGSRNRIISKHVDFILCAPGDLSVVAALELDDASHARAHAQKRDDFVDTTLAAAGIPVHRFSAKHGYSVIEVRRQLGRLLAPRESDAAELERAESDAPLPPEGLGESPDEPDAASAHAADVTCPRCGSAMVRRVAKRGARAGLPFLACSTYPACRGTTDLN